MNNFSLNFLKLGLIISFLLSYQCMYGQMEVVPADGTPYTPEYLMNDIFLGEGVEVTNITYNGFNTSAGLFYNATPDLGLERGVIMSTGLVTDAPGVGCNAGGCSNTNTGNNGTASDGSSGLTDPDLATLAGFSISDAAIFNLTFIPTADTVEFRYVFASEEYETYTCDQNGYNDVFGFFISGPGINGTFTNQAENIALIPDTTLPVSIGTLNSGSPSGSNPASGCASLAHSQYFIDNIGNTGIAVEYNGFTKVLTAKAVVIPCETYNIKLAIGDGTDSAFDSAVFLEANSFGSGNVQVEAATVSVDGTISESCSDATISFTLPNPAESDLVINYTIEGTATNGVDYTQIPATLTIPQGFDSIGIEISGFEDGLVEGVETIFMIVETDVCSSDTVKLFITDYQLSEPIMNDTTICDGTTASLDATIPTFVPDPVTFTNTTNEILFPNQAYYYPIDVGGIPFEELAPGIINSVCFNINTASPTLVYELEIYLISPGGQILELSTQNGGSTDPAEVFGGYINTCFTETSLDPINFNPTGENYGPGSSIPFTGNWLPESPWGDIYGGPVNGQWQLLVYDLAPGFAPTFENWSITFNSDYFINYQWSNSSTLTCSDCATPDAFPSAATTYTVTISDSYGCSITGEVDVDVISQLDAPILNCGTPTSTSVVVEWAEVPGAAGYQVNVDNAGWITVNAGDLFYEATGLTVGQTVTIEVIATSTECSDSNPSSIDCIASPCQLTPSLDDTTHVSCFGEADGTATLSAIGAGTITFDIGGGNTNTSGMFTGLIAGDYTVTITDDDCSLTETFTINEPTQLIASQTFTDVSCNGVADGTITITTSGGTPNYTYAWSGGITDTDEAVDGLAGGDYTVTITDDKNCTITLTQTISENTAITIASTTTDATCNGQANGTATVTPSGGAGSYIYLWDTAAADQITATASGLDVGDYVVTVTDSDNCTATEMVTITAPTSMTTVTSATDASCSGSSDGTATVVASGGAGGYLYEWEDAQATATAINFSDGWHYVTVTDINGCFVIDSAEVTVPNPIALVISGTDATCNGSSDGTAMLVASGGAGGFTYAWSEAGETNANISNLIANTYTVVVTDMNNCVATTTIDISEPTAVSGTMAITNISCNGENDGAITVTSTGGSSNYTYTWSSGLTDTDDTAEGLSPGDYTVTITDDVNCTATVEGTITENPAITTVVTSTDATCDGLANGTATVTPSNGIGVYTYLWDANAANQITDTATGLDVGSYSVTVTDENGCFAIAMATITAPVSIATTTSSTEATCNGSTDGTATVIASGGAGGYTYEWEDAQITATAINFSDGWHYVTVTDLNGCMVVDSAEVTVPNPINLVISGTNVTCNGGNDGTTMIVASGGAGGFTYAWSTAGETNDNMTSVLAGTYTVTVSDINGCTTTESIEITEPDLLTVVLAETNINCFGENTGSIMATATGGTGTITYDWSNTGTTNEITNLLAGTYTVIITDANLCTTSASVEVLENPELTSSMAVGGASCSGGGDGSATVTPNGGLNPYTYLWSDSQITATATGLMAETYSVTVTDAAGCITINSIDVAEPPMLSVSVSGTNINCFGGNNGTTTALGDGGDGNYSYAWNSGAGSTQSNLIAGVYTITITDGNGCTAENTITLDEPTEITVINQITAVSCNGESNGSVNITVSGGTTPYTFAWSDGSTGEDCINVPAGTYTVIITDGNGCEFTESYVITEPTAITTSLSPTDVFCFMGSDGTVSASINGGTQPYTFAWSNGAPTEDLSNIPAGDYTLTVTDANNCTLITTTTVTQPSSGVSVTMSADQVVCFGASTATATASASGGAIGYTYLWSNNATTATINNIGAGTYIVTVTDANNCTTSGQMLVNELAQINIIASPTSASCNNAADGTATITNISGGAGTIISDYSAVWGTNPVQNGLTAVGLQANQSYTVTVTDANACTATNSVVIPNPTAVTVDVVASTPVSCAGEADGSLTVSGFGGTAPYTYVWDNGATTDTATDLALGFYTVTVFDDNGCTVSGTYQVDNPSLLTVSLQEIDVTCTTYNDGGATSNVSGGVPPYAYEWSNGETTADIGNLLEGNYNLTVTDFNGCRVVASVYISEPVWLNFTYEVEGVTCFDDRDGSISITATGGTAPYTYTYSGGIRYEDYSVLVGMSPGVYGVQVQDANGCLSPMNYIEVEEPLPVEVVIDPNIDVVSYEVGDSVQLIANVSNNIDTAIYEWTALYGEQDMSCTDCFNPVVDGYENNRFEVVVTDGNGCKGSAEIEALVTREWEVYVPTGFTPNDDGVNDFLMVHGTSGTRIKSFRVYDKWGELVFKTGTPYNINSVNTEHVWLGDYKGKLMNPGVFVWHLEVKYIDGREESFQGNTTLVR